MLDIYKMIKTFVFLEPFKPSQPMQNPPTSDIVDKPSDANNKPTIPQFQKASTLLQQPFANGLNQQQQFPGLPSRMDLLVTVHRIQVDDNFVDEVVAMTQRLCKEYQNKNPDQYYVSASLYQRHLLALKLLSKFLTHHVKLMATVGKLQLLDIELASSQLENEYLLTYQTVNFVIDALTHPIPEERTSLMYVVKLYLNK